MSHQARKRFGQNFLHDRQVIEKIVQAINPKPGDSILEIGPGQGALTRYLIDSGADVTAVEIDRDLVRRLSQDAHFDSLNLLQTDVLELSLSSVQSTPGKLRVVGNLPYNISSPVLFHMLSQIGNIEDMHFMLQKEVVDRICADPGSKTYGRLSVMIQYQCLPQPLFVVKPGAFNPQPRVDSAVFRLIPRSEPVDTVLLARLEKLVKQAFSQRRKTLARSLSGMLSSHDFELSGIDASRRPETLSVEEFTRLADLLDVPDGADS